MDDVLIVGAGPAGAIAGLVLARAGARVRLVDRATFPRHKLCGDTVNPGTLAHLRRLGIADPIDERGLAVNGMIVTGEHGVAIEGRYPGGLSGRALIRRDFDWLLLAEAIRAGCQLEQGVPVRDPIVANAKGHIAVIGARVGTNGSARELRARVTIAADGRRSAIAFGLGLARHPAAPRRWAIGAYFENVLAPHTTINPPAPAVMPPPPRVRRDTSKPAEFRAGEGGRRARPELANAGAQRMWGHAQHSEHAEHRHGGSLHDAEVLRDTHARSCAAEENCVTSGFTLRDTSVFGEMHVRRGRYIGVAPVPGHVTNVCLVRPSQPGDVDLRDPAALLHAELARDPMLRERFAGARLVAPPTVLGPLAVDARPALIDGLLLAGDAAGFVDPMTGDGLRFAVCGGELAAVAALEALEHGWSGVHARLEWRRRREFASKQRFNRTLRSLVASPCAVAAAAIGARFAPFVLRTLIARAGDCDVAEPLVA